MFEYAYNKKITIQNLEKELDVISKEMRKLNLQMGFFEFVIYVISELLANIKEHAKINEASIILKMDKQKCSIGITDKGVGLKRPYLLKQIYVKDDFAAIELALSGLSTKNLRERGFGLYSIRKFTEELGGKMTVESGSAKALMQKNKINFKYLKNEFHGVAIKIETTVKKTDFYKIIA